MKLFAALWAVALSATLGGSFLGPPLAGQNIQDSLQDSANAVGQAGSWSGSLNMLAPGGNFGGPMSLTQAVSTFQHRASIIDDVYDASGTSWLQHDNAVAQGAGDRSQPSPLGVDGTLANMAAPWMNSAQQQQQQQQQLPALEPLPMLQQLPQAPQQFQMQPMRQMQPVAQTQQFLQSQQFPSPPQMQQPPAFGAMQQVQGLGNTMQQPAASFISGSAVADPLQGTMQQLQGSMQQLQGTMQQPSQLVNPDQLFRDSAPSQQERMEPAAFQSQAQPNFGGASLLTLLGQGQGQGFGPTDPPRDSPWIAMSDPTRDPPQYAMPMNMNTQGSAMPMNFNMQAGNSNAVAFGQQSQQAFLQGGNSNAIAFGQQTQQAFPASEGCILCHSQVAQEAPSQNKWLNYFSKGADEQRKHDEAME